MGHTRKLRFAGIMGASLLATAGMGVAMAQGGISANLALSNTIFNMKVGGLDSEGFTLFVDSDEMHDGTESVSRIKMQKASMSDVCMTAPIKLPGLGDKKFQMVVDGPNMDADNLIIGAKGLEGGMTLLHPQIGVDANQINDKAASGAWGLVAGGLTSDGQAIQATSLSADRLSAAGSKISVEDPDDAKC